MIQEDEITPEGFVLRAIAASKSDGHKGLHTVWSGFNEAFRQHFGAVADPVETTTRMRKAQKIAVFPAKGGVMLYMREDLTAGKLSQHDIDWAERDSGVRQPKTKKSSDAAGQLLSKILKG